ncbi:hypothetical protein KHP62_14755 [Rhodobacteraceae bacterium NNCM2]|nr:hypothetical protein [Coraliihabitans acroporae]
MTSTGAIVAGLGDFTDQAVLIPIAPDVIQNIFEKSRRGRPALRVEDLVALRIELVNLAVTPGKPPKLRKAGRGAPRLILHFPPQAITEETFYEVPPANMDNPDDVPGGEHPHPDKQDKPEPAGGGSEVLRELPVRARIADESRLVFKVPNDAEIDYTLEGILEACQSLEPVVAANARPRPARNVIIKFADLFNQRAVNALSPKQRAALAAHAASSLRIGALSGDTATLRLRQGAGGPLLRAVPDLKQTRVGLLPKRQPRPANPSVRTTAIELPWRLIVSPHAGSRWRHSASPFRSPATERTELWHTRMVTPKSDGSEIVPPYPDPNRTIRAVWAKSGTGIEAATPPMQSAWPDSNLLPPPGTSPFRMPLDNFDRYQIAHLSSNFSVPGYVPEPVDTKLLMLSSLGGWLDSRGAWDPPGLSVEEWVHRATMARDHYVKVVYRGFLFPFGNRVSLVKVTERKFHNGQATAEQTPGNIAYLRQRYFIVIREKERTFDDSGFAAAKSNDGKTVYANQFPFSRIEILTETTPDLDDPGVPLSSVDNKGQLMFWPHVGGSPFRFQCAATDLDGRRSIFDLPMIFMDNTQACPRFFDNGTGKLEPLFSAAESNANLAATTYAAASDRNSAQFDQQRVAMAPPIKSGDTSVEVVEMTFGGDVEVNNTSLRNYSDDLSRPVFVPKVVEVEAKLGAVANLTGSAKTNILRWNAHFLQFGFNAKPTGQPGPNDNRGEVFVDVIETSGMAQLDFSSQGDKSGGFMQPNLRPKALSRVAGPVMSDIDQFISGQMPPGAGFPTSPGDLPLPLLFGCIPLGDLIEAVTDLTGAPERVPKFVSEAGTQVETFINTLVRLFGLAHDLATDPVAVVSGLLTAFRATLDDQIAQGQAYAASQVGAVLSKIGEVQIAIDDLLSRLQALSGLGVDALDGAPDFLALPGEITTARARIQELRDLANAQVNGVSLPAGFRQSILNLCAQLDAALEALEDLATLVSTGKALFEALDDIVGDPAALGDLLADPGEMGTRLQALVAAIGPFRTALADFDLMGDAVKQSLVSALDDVEDVLGVVADLVQLLENLTGDELTIRFDWNPEIGSFPPSNPIFRANDTRGLLVAVEGKVKKNGTSSPKISVTCSLRSFDLVLIAPASFIELNFDRILFSIDSKSKMDVDVLLSDIKFVGPLSFVETLRDLIPLDGFSDPPYLDISTEGIDAGFDIALPSIAVGVLNISNLSLGAGFTVPFIGQPLSVRFNFCTREQPFLLTVYMFGGGGFFGVTIDPNGVQILEASFEFGASISVDFGVASGGVHVMAGIYFRMEMDEATLTGYFRLGGHVDVLGLITASLELYLELTYESASGKCTGKAQLTIEVSVLVFSGSVTISCERKFAGANGDPTLRQMMGLDPALSLEDELAAINGPKVEYAWRDYCEAFA